MIGRMMEPVALQMANLGFSMPVLLEPYVMLQPMPPVEKRILAVIKPFQLTVIEPFYDIVFSKFRRDIVYLFS